MTSLAVVVSQLRRTFVNRADRSGPDRVALAGMDLNIAEGETHGLLGPNGAGKTTLVRILSTVLLPTSGSATVLGHDVEREAKAVRRRIGIVFGGDRGLYSRISGRDNLLFWASLYGLGPKAARHRTDALLDRLGLLDRASQPVEEYSRGMKQRLHLARGLIADPRVLFLDEPTVGMDPVAAREFRRLVRELRSAGRTILLTTHDMAEAEAVCDRISLIDAGRLLMTEQTEHVGRLLAIGDRIDFVCDDTGVVDALRLRTDVAMVSAQGETASRFRLVPTGGADVRDLMRVLLDYGITTLEAAPPRLEEVYLTLLGDRGLEV